jgi:PKD repeat protein
MKRLLLLVCTAAAFNAIAQKPCGTETQYKKIIAADPAAAEKRQQLEEFTQSYISNPLQRSSSAVKIIPIVFHIIHNYGSENISDAQVIDAVRIINEDFRKLNSDTNLIVPDFKPLAADCQVEFRLAQKDPNGNCTNGITRTVSNLTYSADDNVKELISWDNDKYLNIWVVSSISFGAGGYAYYPGTAPTGGEGVVVLYSQLGSIGGSCGTNFCARTLTHEIGHYFNLAHTWGSNNDCGNSSACGDDDGVTDTPNTSGSCQGCNLAQSSCGFLDNVQNYMDYSSCTRMFTIGQVQRMNAALNSSIGDRNNLWQASNLNFTGVNIVPAPPCTPVADLKANYTGVCAGGSITYKDMSWNAHPTAWSWQFPGGTPSTSTDSMPVIQYNTPGTYNVTLTASTSAGSNTITKTGLITVSAAMADHTGPSYFEGFETTTIPGTEWKIADADGGAKWQRTTSAAAAGTASAWIDNSFNAAFEPDELISPSINLSNIPSPVMTFRLAFEAWDTLDRLQVLLSRDCGRTWTQRYSKKGNGLITSSSGAFFFVPSAGDWRTESVSVASYANDQNVMVKFRYINSSGNNIYIDNINITSSTTGINEEESEYHLNVFPNPASDKAVLSYEIPAQQKVSIHIYNALGQEVFTQAAAMMNEGSHELTIDTSDLGAGIYNVNLQTPAGMLVRRLVVR